MSEIFGLIWASTASLFFGSQFTTFKIAKEKPSVAEYQFMTAVGIFLMSLVLVPFFKFSFAINLAGICGGILWTFGNFFATKAVEKSGLAKTMPIWGGIVVMVSFIVGILFFHEAISNFPPLILGSIAIILGIFFVSKGYQSNSGGTSSAGIKFAVFAGLLFGIQFVPLKLANLTANEFLFPMSFGILITAMIIFLFHRERFSKVAVLNGIAGGAIWNIGNLSLIFAIGYLGVAVASSLAQFGAVVSVLWGLLVFREITESKKKAIVFLGALIVTLGAAALAFSK